MDTQTTISLSGQTWEPEAPGDFAIIVDLVLLVPTNFQRAYAGALVATWGGKDRPKISYASSGYSAGRFGGACLSELIERGCTLEEIIEQGRTAMACLSERYVGKQSLKNAEDFSEPGGESSTAG